MAHQAQKVRDLAMLDQLHTLMPIAPQTVSLSDGPVGLVIIDEVNGFATVGCGPLAPPVPNAQVDAMVAETDRLARLFSAKGQPILATLDSHDPDRPEPPYPTHCLKGSGDDELIPALKWLETDEQTTLMQKDCINALVGGWREDGGNTVLEWINAHGLRQVVVVGICTDICVMDFVLTLLSARNHGLTDALADIIVHAPGCATYDLPRPVAEELGLPVTAAHPQAPAHHLGLYFMASRGAIISNGLAGL